MTTLPPTPPDDSASDVLVERKDGIRIVRLDTYADSLPYRAAFAGAYQTVFSEPPYNERFYPSEAEAVLRTHLETAEHIVLLAVRGISQVVGFGLAVPANARPDVARELRGLLPVRRTMYLSELGVLQRYRGSGLGRQLVHLRLSLVDPSRFAHIVLRTSANRDGAYGMYMGLDFEDMGVYMEVAARRNDGSVSTDRRLFLTRQLDPVSHAPSSDPHSFDEDTSDSATWAPEG
jgi:ribosomal protein S18 acetylase RimI-like enzyme